VVVSYLAVVLVGVGFGALESGMHINGSWVLEENDISGTAFTFVTGASIEDKDSTTANILFRSIPTLFLGA